MPRAMLVEGKNRLLDALPKAELQHFFERCESVDLAVGDVLVQAGEPIRHVYFPTQGFMTLRMPFEAARSLEIGLIGDEGMWGAPVVLGVEESPFCVVVQGSGNAIRISTAAFCHELVSTPSLHHQLKRYSHFLMRQLAQSVGCARYHVIEARLARWLLMTCDCAHSHQIHATHELLSRMLGVRRVGVTRAAAALQQQQLIAYRRGDIVITDRSGLEGVACNCYRADRTSYEELLTAEVVTPLVCIA